MGVYIEYKFQTPICTHLSGLANHLARNIMDPAVQKSSIMANGESRLGSLCVSGQQPQPLWVSMFLLWRMDRISFRPRILLCWGHREESVTEPQMGSWIDKLCGPSYLSQLLDCSLIARRQPQAIRRQMGMAVCQYNLMDTETCISHNFDVPQNTILLMFFNYLKR